MRDAVRQLKDVEDTVLSINKEYLPSEWKNIYPDEWRLWPTDFLAILPSIHTATKDFLNHPTHANAEQLIKLYEKTARDYKKAIDLHLVALNNFLEIYPDRRERRLRYIRVATTPVIIKKDFELVQDNAQELIDEIGRRKTCLSYGLRCPIPRKNTISKNTPSEAQKIPLKALPLEIMTNWRHGTPIERAGPYWVTTPCLGYSSEGKLLSQPFFMVILKSENGSRNVLMPAFANEMFYHDLNFGTTTRALAMEHQYGYSYTTQHPSTRYMCPNLTYYANVYAEYLKASGHLDSDSDNKLFTLPYIISRLASNQMDALVFGSRYSKKSPNPLFLLINESIYSLFFGSFSPAIWRVDGQLQFLLPRNFETQPALVSYPDLLKRGLSQEEILSIHHQESRNEIYRQLNAEDFNNDE